MRPRLPIGVGLFMEPGERCCVSGGGSQLSLVVVDWIPHWGDFNGGVKLPFLEVDNGNQNAPLSDGLLCSSITIPIPMLTSHLFHSPTHYALFH
jgi:hypothetical protein